MNISDRIAVEYQNNAAYMNILSRVSVRRFKDEPISDQQLTALLHAAMSAPSGVNKQPWEFIVVDNRELLNRLADALPYAKMLAHSPLAIVVCGNKARMLDGADNNLWEQDCSAVSENLLLAAHAIGLGGVWTCLYPHADRMESVVKILNIGPDMIPFNIIPIGRPETDAKAINKWNAERVHFNRQ